MKTQLLGIFILAIVMIVLPIHLRFAQGNPTLAGIEPYYHARLAMELTEGIPKRDDAIVNGRPYILSPYHIILSLGYRAMGELAFNLLPILFALSSWIFLWLLLRALNVPKGIQPWILLAYALSPPLLAAGAIGTPNAFILAILMLGTWLMLGPVWILGALAFFIASLSGIFYNATAIIILLLLVMIKRNKKYAAIVALLCLAVFVAGYAPPGIPQPREVPQYLSDFGGMYGFSIFAFLLALVGAAIIWKHKKKYYGAYAIMIIFLISSFLFTKLLVFANLIVSALAGIALASLAQRKWELRFLRQAALLVLFCGLLFSSISHAVSLAEMQPSPTFFKALEFPPGTVLSHESYGFWVEAAGHRAVIDPLWKELANPQDQAWDVAAIFSSTDLMKTKQLLKKYGITHVLITPEMRHGLLWEREQQGLDFLVENSETFKRVESGSDIEAWQTS